MIRVGMSQIVSSMRHRKSAYSSLVLEVALGSTVVAYALGLGSALHDMTGNTIGFDETRSFAVAIEQPLGGSHAERTAHEQAELRGMPGVQAVAWVDLPPLSRCELPIEAMTSGGPRQLWVMRGDSGLAPALGAHLAAGRWLGPADAESRGPIPVLVTRSLAEQLRERALGARLSAPGLGSLSVVGVVDEALRINPFYETPSEIVIMAARPAETRRTNYLVRTAVGESGSFAGGAIAKLATSGHGRGVQVTPLAYAREQLVRNVHGADTIIVITVFGMVLVVLVGSIGMASSLIVERARQIGIRRALGARTLDIVGYFMLENLFATALGLLIGAGLCAVLDEVLAPVRGALVIGWHAYLPLSAGLFVLAGQVSVLLPAHRAACAACCITAPRTA
jgi:putative ABC transport system permease protein